MEKLITIITINYNTAEFIDLMLYAFKKLTLNSYKVLICDNGSNDEELLKLVKVVQKYENVEIIFRVQSQAGSIGHAEALDLLIEKVDTKYTVIMDSDCTFLMKSWDKHVIDKISDVVKIVGTPRQTKDSHNALTKKVYGDFPSPYAVLFDTDIYKQLNISCMPGNIDEGKDTVWEWKSKFESDNYSGHSLNMINTRFTNDQFFPNLVGIAVYYMDNKLMASHFGRGSSGGVSKYKNWYYWRIPIISSFLRKQRSLQEKENWILKSTRIIDTMNKEI